MGDFGHPGGFGQKMGADVIKENEDLKGYIKKMQETIYITP